MKYNIEKHISNLFVRTSVLFVFRVGHIIVTAYAAYSRASPNSYARYRRAVLYRGIYGLLKTSMYTYIYTL